MHEVLSLKSSAGAIKRARAALLVYGFIMTSSTTKKRFPLFALLRPISTIHQSSFFAYFLWNKSRRISMRMVCTLF